MRHTWRVGTGICAMALVATACGGAQQTRGADEATEAGALSGSIAIDGSSTVEPITAAIAEEYHNEEPDVVVNVGRSGTGGGFERFCGTGDIQISDASRPIKQEEAAMCAENGIEYVELRIGTDALTMVVNPDVEFAQCLTTEEVQKIWGPEGATSWDKVRPDFPAEPLAVFAPDTDSGTYDFFNETILAPAGIEQPRQDYNASADDNIIAQGVIGTPGAWGYFGFAFFEGSADQLKALEYDAGEGCVAPSVSSAQDDSYKLTRPLFIYVRTDALTRPEVAGFATFYLDTVNSLIADVGYIAEPDADLEMAKTALQEAIGATG